MTSLPPCPKCSSEYVYEDAGISSAVTAPRPICNKSGEASCFFNTARTIVRVLHVSTGFGS